MPADAGRALRSRRGAANRAAAAVAVLLLVVVLGRAIPAASAAAAPPARSVARVAGELPVPEQTPQDSDAKADEILSRSEFDEAEPGWFQRAGEWIVDGLASLLGDAFTGGVGSAVAWGVLALAVGGVALLVARFVRTVQHEPTRPEAAVLVEVRRAPDDWRREAEAHEARDEWKAALRCRYRALVADLVARRVVRDLPGRTTGEHRADVAATLPTAAADFAGASELFERAWYGDLPTGPDENARFRALADHVVELAGHPPRGHHDDASDDPDDAGGATAGRRELVS